MILAALIAASMQVAEPAELRAEVNAANIQWVES